MRNATITFLTLLQIIVLTSALTAQDPDTVSVSLQEFIDLGLERSGKIKMEKTEIDLAENKIVKSKSLKFLPEAKIETQHGLVPGVESDSILPNGQPLPDGQLYLDPNLDNNLNDLNLFTRGEISAIQPIFGWGAINNAIAAAKAGAKAAEFNFSAEKEKFKLQLYKLYYSYLLSMELERLVEEAQNAINNIDKKLAKMEEEGDPDLDISDYYKFKIFRAQFKTKIAEVAEGKKLVENTWNWMLKNDGQIIYIPDKKFLDPVADSLQTLPYYRQKALAARYELNAIDATIQAANLGVSAAEAQNLPMLFLGLSVSGAFTPNRPRQTNPFIRNRSNFFGAAFGFGIRQNLNYFSIKSNIQKNKIQYRQSKHLRESAVEGIILQINRSYKDATVAKQRMQNNQEALKISKQWERQEQVDYDLGFGEPKDLLEAIRAKLELEVKVKEDMYQFNLNMARLYNASGIFVEELQMN